MDERADFLRAIRANPLDDAPRLIFADWLDEHDDPHAANFLRVELDVASRLPDKEGLDEARAKLWDAWANVDEAFFHTFTQPSMMRANPTPFETTWIGPPLERVRPHGTIGGPYHTLPDIAVPNDLTFAYIKNTPQRPLRRDAAMRDVDARQLRQTVKRASRKNFALPPAYYAFMSDPELIHTRTMRNSSFQFGWRIDSDALTNSSFLPFYSDDRLTLLWDVCIRPNGAYCIMARTRDYFTGSATQRLERAWFVAPSFSAFVYRMWLENTLWLCHNEPAFTGVAPELAAILDAYIAHYQR